MTSKRKAVEDTLRKMNVAWRQGNVPELARYFHPDMVIADAALYPKYSGRDACVRHLQQFVQYVKIEEFKDSDYQTAAWDNTATVSYRFEILFRSGEETRKEAGRELYVFTNKDNEWLAVWSMVIMQSDQAVAT